MNRKETAPPAMLIYKQEFLPATHMRQHSPFSNDVRSRITFHFFEEEVYPSEADSIK